MEEERMLVKMRWIRTVTYSIVVMQRVGLHFKLLITPCSRDMIIAWRWRRVVGFNNLKMHHVFINSCIGIGKEIHKCQWYHSMSYTMY